MNFKDWIYSKFVEWRGDTRNSISEFAIFLNVSQPTVSAWVNGTRGAPKSSRVVQELVSRYGSEVYSVLGLEAPGDPLLLMPEPFRSIALELKKTLEEKQIPPDSPRAAEVMDEIMKKYGYGLIATREEPLE